MDKISVIHVCVGLNVGGTEKLLVEFARHADRSRFDLQFISLSSRGALARQIEQLGWPVTALNMSPGVKPAIIFRLAQLFRHAKATVVHTHNTKPLLYAVPAARFAGVPTTIHTRHGQRFGSTRRQNYLFNLTSGWVDQIVSVSDDGTRLSLLHGLPPEKLVTIHNGIDISFFPATVPQESEPIVFVGRLSPEKDVATLLHAAAIAIKQEPSLRLQLAGDGPILSDLRKLADYLGITAHVTFLGQTSDVAAVLAGASLFVLPSVTEGISLALLEAMARGLPVVATAVGGNTEVVVDGETGFLVPPGSPANLAGAMLKIYRQPELARQMGAQGRKRVESRFCSRNMVASYESLYLSNLSNRAAA